MLQRQANMSSAMLADSAITVDVEKPALVVEEETTPDTAAESEFRVPDAEDAWAAVRHALFLPGTAVPTLPSLLSYFSDSAEIVFVATGNVVKGRAAIMELFKQTAAAGYTYDGTQNEIVSQMAGRDRVSGQRMMIETLILALVHDQPIGWLLPDVKPTKKRLLVPVDVTVFFSTDVETMDRVISKIRILHDQASTMKQILLLPESLYCKGNNAETKLPAIGIKVADPLMGNRQARMSPEERPIKASLASPVRKNDSRIFDPPEPMLLRTSTRIFQKPQANIFGDEVEGVRRGQFDPRRFETHFNVFNPSEALVPDSPPKSGKKLIAVNPNLTSHMAAIGISAPPPENDVDCFKPSRKLVADPTAKPVEEREEIYKPSRKLFQEVLQTVAEPEEETFVPGLKQFNRVGQPTHIYGLTGMEQEIQRSPIKGNGDWRAEGRKPRGNESQFSISGESPKSAASAITGSRPSSRVTRPPGGASSFSLA